MVMQLSYLVSFQKSEILEFYFIQLKQGVFSIRICIYSRLEEFVGQRLGNVGIEFIVDYLYSYFLCSMKF